MNFIYRCYNELVTTSLAIAKGTENQHKSVIQLIRNNISDLEEFGSLAFEMRVMREDGRGGEPTEYALLNEQQATVLITFMRNSEIVKSFKINSSKGMEKNAEYVNRH